MVHSMSRNSGGAAKLRLRLPLRGSGLSGCFSGRSSHIMTHTVADEMAAVWLCWTWIALREGLVLPLDGGLGPELCSSRHGRPVSDTPTSNRGQDGGRHQSHHSRPRGDPGHTLLWTRFRERRLARWRRSVELPGSLRSSEVGPARKTPSCPCSAYQLRCVGSPTASFIAAAPGKPSGPMAVMGILVDLLNWTRSARRGGSVSDAAPASPG